MPEKPWSDLSRHEERSQSGCDHQQEIDPAKQLVRGRAFSPQQQECAEEKCRHYCR